MRLISNQIDELRAYAKGRKGELAKLINGAANTIEMLSAKLHTTQTKWDNDELWGELSKVYNMPGLPDEVYGIIGDVMVSLPEDKCDRCRFKFLEKAEEESE